VAKQRQVKLEYRQGSLAAIQQLESRNDEQLESESKHKAAAQAILGARAAERYDAKAARGHFNRALAACTPQERPALRQMMKASMALAERRPDDLKQAVEKLGQEAPSSRQLLLLRVMGLVAPPPGSGALLRLRGIFILIAIVIGLLALGFGVAMLVTLPFGGAGIAGGLLLGAVIVIAALAIFALLGRRRQARAKAARSVG